MWQVAPMMESVGVERTCGSRRFSGQHCCRLGLPGRARLPKWGPKLCPAYHLPLPQVAGGPSPTPAGPQALDVDSCLDSSMLDSSMLAFPGLSGEVRAPRGLPGWGCGLGTLGSGSLCSSQQAFAGQMKQDLFLEDSKRWGP